MVGARGKAARTGHRARGEAHNEIIGAGRSVPARVRDLAATGYDGQGDLGVPARQAFQPARDEGLPAHHLYLVVDGNRAHQDHVLLRDLLREDADARAREQRGLPPVDCWQPDLDALS